MVDGLRALAATVAVGSGVVRTLDTDERTIGFMLRLVKIHRWRSVRRGYWRSYLAARNDRLPGRRFRAGCRFWCLSRHLRC